MNVSLQTNCGFTEGRFEFLTFNRYNNWKKYNTFQTNLRRISTYKNITAVLKDLIFYRWLLLACR